jgi:hypothetical protein
VSGAATKYHRLRNTTTQTVQVDALMQTTGQVCGNAGWGQTTPTAKAFWGPLKASDSGLEFETTVPPTPGASVPSYAIWRPGSPGVTSINGLTCIPAVNFRSVP